MADGGRTSRVSPACVHTARAYLPPGRRRRRRRARRERGTRGQRNTHACGIYRTFGTRIRGAVYLYCFFSLFTSSFFSLTSFLGSFFPSFRFFFLFFLLSRYSCVYTRARAQPDYSLYTCINIYSRRRRAHGLSKNQYALYTVSPTRTYYART